jgi:hypothetical protein
MSGLGPKVRPTTKGQTGMTNKPSMEHRHYKAIAAIIASLPDGEMRQHVAEHFARELRGTNPRFSGERFRTAAMGEPINARDAVR